MGEDLKRLTRGVVPAQLVPVRPRSQRSDARPRADPLTGRAAVIGRPDPRWGECPYGFVRLRGEAPPSVDDLKAWANERLAKHQRIAGLAIHREPLPRNALGKVLKAELRKLLDR